MLRKLLQPSSENKRDFFICTFHFSSSHGRDISFSSNLFFYLCFSSVPNFHPSFQCLDFPYESQFTGPNSFILQPRCSPYPAFSLPPFTLTYFQPLLISLQAPGCLSVSLNLPLPDLWIRTHLLSFLLSLCVPEYSFCLSPGFSMLNFLRTNPNFRGNKNSQKKSISKKCQWIFFLILN